MESSSSDGRNEWRAEEAIAGNAQALEALRELITFPLYYSCEAQKLGLKVISFVPFRWRDNTGKNV